MWGLIALLVYSIQWLGIVLGVGAETVLLVGHLTALHQHKPQWLDNIPAVREVQRWGLVLIVASGLGAVLYQIFNDPAVLFIATFGFKWLLIAIIAGAFWAERFARRGRAALEGFAGAAWYGLFVVHSVAPVFGWVDLALMFAVWVALFEAFWGGTVWVMKRGSSAGFSSHQVLGSPRPVAKQPARPEHVAQKPTPSEPVIKIIAPPPKPVAPPPAPKPVMAAVSAPIPKVVSPPPPPPKPAAVPLVPKPLAVLANLPVVEYLELSAPKRPEPKVAEPVYVPDYSNLPGVRVMPQKPEDLAHESRAPIVQPA